MGCCRAFEAEAGKDGIWICGAAGVSQRIRLIDEVLCGRFAEIAELSKITLDAIDYAPRFGNHDDKMDRTKLYGRRELPYQDFDWQAVRDAIETLSGWKERQAELKELKRAAIGRATKHKITRKTKMVIAEILHAPAIRHFIFERKRRRSSSRLVRSLFATAVHRLPDGRGRHLTVFIH